MPPHSLRRLTTIPKTLMLRSQRPQSPLLRLQKEVITLLHQPKRQTRSAKPMRAPQVIRAGGREAFFLCDAQRAIEFVCAPEAAVAGDAEVDGGGEAGEFVVVGGVVGGGGGGGALGGRS